ncbi:alpha/beta hydrolase [Aminobacter sp. AP02]|uniref:alpha/beta fold hydrolase n=1 Tax=Aminobacter sp. AP02 TaxID=2135737 RepID=UPI000D6D07CB|nr:alpha/beta hydrolase [Aminobacter sp. AP02]PWK65794.1 pimeloyl-ACP methyl ester carboxylesterase [Aminobacter sp. AP02]
MATAFTVLGWVASIAFLAVALVVGYFVLATSRIAKEAERAVPASGRFLEFGRHRIHYVDQGQGRPIVFLHGLGGQLHHFSGTLFSRLDGEFRLIALDRPGSGYSSRPSDFAGSLREQAEVVYRVIKKLGLEKPLVVGHSLGGAVALTLALEHPEAMSGLVLLSPLTHLEDELRPEFRSLYVRSALLRRLMAQTVWVPTSLKYAPQTLGFVFGPQEPTKDYGTVGGGLAGLRRSHIYATSADLVAIERDLGDVEARYEEIAVPVGVLFGTSDRVIDYRLNGQSLTGRIRNMELDLVDGLGHMPQFIEPDRVAALIVRTAAKAFALSARTPMQ